MIAPTCYNSQFYAGLSERVSSSAEACVPLIMDLLSPCSVVDVGCGQGDWLYAFQLRGIDDIRGIDGMHVKREDLRILPAAFRSWDLTQALVVDRRFDLALSLEVGEHLPERCASQFVRSLTALAPAIVFSAAVPGQGGVQHVNEQWPWYWQNLFAAAGYCCLDILRKDLWQQSKVAAFYQQNIYLYLDSNVYAELIRKHPEAQDTRLTLVQTYILKDLAQKTFWQRLRDLLYVRSRP